MSAGCPAVDAAAKVRAAVRLRPVLGSLSAIVVAVLGACQESPSFRARWDLRPRPNPDVLDDTPDPFSITRAIDCTALGINAVRMTTIDGIGDIADDRIFPCYLPRFVDSHADVGGPHLDPGPYAVELRGVQRNGEPWLSGTPDPHAEVRCDPRVEEPSCQSVDIACDCAPLDVVDEHTERLKDFVLDAPAECIDGIDNDRDGLVDGQERGCLIEPDRPESENIGTVQFRAIVTLFDDAPGVDCGEVGLSFLSARTCAVDPDGEVGTCTGTDNETPVCLAGSPIFFDVALGKGDYLLELTGLDGAKTPLTAVARTKPFKVDDSGSGASVAFETDFGVDDFLVPVHQPASFRLAYAQGPGLDDTRECKPGKRQGQLVMDAVVMVLLDAHGGALDHPITATLDHDFLLDGSAVPCQPAQVDTEPLDWGGYSLRVEARAADGTACFTTDGQHGEPDAPLRVYPGITDLVIPRVVDQDGAPPPSCVDCSTAEECDGNACVAGICQP
jgi:hypothetical protein